MRAVLYILLALLPLESWASGGEILSLLWLAIGMFIVVVASLLLSGLSTLSKLAVFGAYLAGLGVAVALVWNAPYQGNQVLTSAVSAGVPLCIWLIAFGLAWRREHNKRLQPTAREKARSG